MKKRFIPKPKQHRNVMYLFFISLTLLAAVEIGGVLAWGIFVATAIYFWPQGHYGRWGVK